jgi:S-DNA-T family DNA segregation ATPase FtsK/SpoIIIE
MQPDTRPGLLRTLARLAWRYRSELAPAWTALALLVICTLVRPVFYGPGLGWKLAALTLVTVGAASGLWQWGSVLRLDREVERAYAAVLTLAAGLWFALATVLGPLRNSVLAIWLAGSIVAAAPWWWHRRIRRSQRRAESVITAWRADLERHEEGSVLSRPRFDGDGGFEILWQLAPGRVLEDIRSAVDRLESLLDLRPGAIEVSQGERSARDIVLRIQPRDPHKAARLYAGPPRDASIRKPCVIARYQDGGDAGLVLVGVQLLIAGATGSGKSVVVNEVVWFLATCRDVVLGGCDFKGGVELGPWEGVFAPGWFADTPERAVQVLEAAVRVITYREGWMRREGVRTWPTSPERPALVIVIDEIQRVSANKRAIEAIKVITAQGRAMAVSVVVATQYPTVDALGGPKDGALIAANMTATVCLRVKSPAHANVAFGPGAARNGWLPHEISPSKPGSLYLRATGAEEPRLARSDQVTDQMVERAASTLGPHRPRLDEGSEHAALGTPDSTPPGARVGTPDGSRVGTVPWPRGGTSDSTPVGGAAGASDSTVPVGESGATAALQAALKAAGERGTKVTELVEALRRAGIKRRGTWVYDRLGEWVTTGRVSRGPHSRWIWRPDQDDEEGGLPTR